MPTHVSEEHTGEVISAKSSVEGEVKVTISNSEIKVSSLPCLNVQFKWENGVSQVIDLNLYKKTFNTKTIMHKLFILWPQSFNLLPFNCKDKITQLICCNSENLNSKLPNEVMEVIIRNILVYHISIAADD